MTTASKALRSRLSSSQSPWSDTDSGIPPSGRGVPARRLIQMRSAQSRWLRGAWIAEERPAITSPLGVGKRVSGAIEVLVLPAVIARHAMHIAEGDHRLVRRT